jgi:putative oxygen-independent coproporphyrinogen III oxidase
MSIRILTTRHRPSCATRRTSVNPPIQLYIHVPFCEKKCHYCDFASWELPAVQQRRWTEVLVRELEKRAVLGQGRWVDTVFFGGGTPSLLATEFLDRIVQRMRSLYDISRMREMSIECNPSSLTKEKLQLYHELGFTRLSLGIQSFHASELSRLGRVHTVETAGLALETVAADGRFQFSGDLIFGVPGQTEATFLQSLRTLLSYKPDHVSFYGLTIEAGTEFAKQQQSGALVLPEDGTYNEMYTKGVELLRVNDYERYEVSNFSRPGRPCFHNVGYWNSIEYLAFGPGAHQFFGNRRDVSPKSFEGYLEWGSRDFDAGSCESEELTLENRISEAVLLGLRQGRGFSIEALSLMGFRAHAETLRKWEKVGMLEQANGYVTLVDEGWLFLDEIGSDLLARGIFL